MLGPTKDNLLQTQKESLQNDLFQYDLQQSTLEANISTLTFMSTLERGPQGNADRLADMKKRLTEVNLRRANLTTSVANVTKEMERALKIRDAQSSSMEIPQDEEKIKYQEYLDAHGGNDDGNFVFPEPDLDSVHKYIRNYESRSGVVNPRSFLTKLFNYEKVF